MIPGVFEYHRPSTITEAAGLLTRFGDDARVLAGGHSLIPMMKLRVANPEHLIDLQDVGELKGVSITSDEISIGAMVTQHELIQNDALASAVPIIREAALQIADPQVRYVGTIGGNVANGDPGNDMPGLMQCLDASYEVAGDKGTRRIAAREFYEGAFFTALADDEILTRIVIAKPQAGSGYAYEKQKRKIGDYATAAAAVIVGPGIGSIAMTNLGDTPIWSAGANDALAKGDVDGAVNAVMAAISPASDNRGPAEFKKHLAGVILRRAIERAQGRAN
ncbi:xanthine dehydrogenase family protein subunit M [Stappia sp. GBMRC 2046]|uniref:Xanthine dehydrogenase family protein subunit M n=1 Tax=Stappia sediminis TaxID=2692190 RepID=A0A7X3LXI5_9HYPH|nr:xanthine dehydrogenase family protein subunit M [Stappia sediminis]MXN66994.1 xanthine dehydrogenase family protein subunit M [Stappia sediminis]